MCGRGDLFWVAEGPGCSARMRERCRQRVGGALQLSRQEVPGKYFISAGHADCGSSPEVEDTVDAADDRKDTWVSLRVCGSWGEGRGQRGGELQIRCRKRGRNWPDDE